MSDRYCFFCDGRVQGDPHHCLLTFGYERTYSLEELVKVKEELVQRKINLRKLANSLSLPKEKPFNGDK